MMKKFSPKEWYSVQAAKNPRRTVLIAIFILNLVFFFVSALIISMLAPKNVPYRGFWASVYYTVTMTLDAGCIENVISDIGQAGVAVIIACIVIVILGMIIFSGAIIGYVTSYISDFIETANDGGRTINTSGHTIILNWNSRAAEIINDMLFSDEKQLVVVMVHSGKEQVQREISERLSDTISRENQNLRRECASMNPLKRFFYLHKHKLRMRVTYIVREGDTFSLKQLSDISVKHARSVIILNSDRNRTLCRYETEDERERYMKGNSSLIKTLIQVANLTGTEDSYDDQRVIVEVTDRWTQSLVDRIIAQKGVQKKNDLIDLPVNRILGQLLSQFTIMPELNLVYSELFSNKGAAFYTRHISKITQEVSISSYLSNHFCAIPLTEMDTVEGRKCVLMAESDEIMDHVDTAESPEIIPKIRLNQSYYFPRTNILILGHNSNIESIMDGFMAFRGEWNYKTPEHVAKHGGEEVLHVTVIDTPESLDRHDHYRKYPFVEETIPADIFDHDVICSAINRSLDRDHNDTSVLVLSDDSVSQENLDSNVLTYLIYIRDIMEERLQTDPNFRKGRLDVIVEILNPKNYDVANNYSIDYIVISNRYLSRMVGQISEKEDIYRFYSDILTYDTEETEDYNSKELYIKRAGAFFDGLPEECCAAALIRGVYEAGPENNKSMVLGYIRNDSQMILFSGDQRQVRVKLEPDDKLILFTNH